MYTLIIDGEDNGLCECLCVSVCSYGFFFVTFGEGDFDVARAGFSDFSVADAGIFSVAESVSAAAAGFCGRGLSGVTDGGARWPCRTANPS